MTKWIAMLSTLALIQLLALLTSKWVNVMVKATKGHAAVCGVCA